MGKVKQELPWISYGDLWTLGGDTLVTVVLLQSRSVFLLSTAIYFPYFISYRKWLAARSPGDEASLTISLPRLHLMDVCLMLLRVWNALYVSFTGLNVYICNAKYFNKF